MSRILLLAVVLLSCQRPPVASVAAGTVVANRTTRPTMVYVSFGANSRVRGWPFCVGSPTCSFPLAAGATRSLPSNGRALNITVSFGTAPSCGATVVEYNTNIPGWTSDTADISLVNGWSNNVRVDVAGGRTLGPTRGPRGNENVYGVFPVGCDVCVARQQPPCGIAPCPTPGTCGCHAGTQYRPTVPCQSSFARGTAVTIALVGP